MNEERKFKLEENQVTISSFGPQTENPPIVSVLMLTYNHESFIRDAIAGVFSQRVEGPVELVIGDDCSTDGTFREIAIACQNAPISVRVLRPQKNAGLLRNFIRTANACRGDYVALLEGDDSWICPEKLRIQIAALSKQRAEICFHPCIVDYTNGRLPEEHSNMGRSSMLLGLNDVICGDGGMMPTASILIRKRALSSIPLCLIDDGVIDYFVQIWASLRGGALYMPDCCARYRSGVPGSWTERMRDKKYEFKQFFSIATRLRLLERHLPATAITSARKMTVRYLERSLESSGCPQELRPVLEAELGIERKQLGLSQKRDALINILAWPSTGLRRLIKKSFKLVGQHDWGRGL